jgi:hypothetical protein
VKAGCLCRHLAGPRIQQIAELEYAIDPNASVGSTITENRSSIPPFPLIFTSTDRNSGSLCRYIREYNEIPDDNGTRLRYIRQRLVTKYAAVEKNRKPPKQVKGKRNNHELTQAGEERICFERTFAQ